MRLLLLDRGRAVINGFSRDHGQTYHRFWGIDLRSQAPKWIPKDVRKGDNGFLYWYEDGWKRMKYKWEDGLRQLLAERSGADPELLQAAQERRITPAMLTAEAYTRARAFGLTAHARVAVELPSPWRLWARQSVCDAVAHGWDSPLAELDEDGLTLEGEHGWTTLRLLDGGRATFRGEGWQCSYEDGRWWSLAEPEGMEEISWGFFDEESTRDVLLGMLGPLEDWERDIVAGAATALIAAAHERAVTREHLSSLAAHADAAFARAVELGLTADGPIPVTGGAGELPGRMTPPGTAELGKLAARLRHAADLAGGECTLLAMVTPRGAEVTFDQQSLREDVPLNWAIMQYAETLREVEADPRRGAWLFLRVHAHPGGLEIERAYDHCPPWWDASLGLPVEEFREEFARRAPEWRPAWP